MELRQLRYFAAVAETLNFSEAARRMCVTQSTLSQQVKQLETELDTPLLIRTSHTVELTEAGRELLPYAMRTLRDADTCLTRISDLNGLNCGELNIGVTYTFSPILTETLLEFMKLYPRITLNIVYKPMAELTDLLLRRSIDFMLAFRSDHPHPAIETHILFQNFLAAIVAENHPLAKQRSATLHDLERYDMALPTKGLQARNAFDAVAAESVSRMRVRIELNEPNILLKLVRRTSLVTVLAEATIHNEQGVVAVPLDLPSGEMAGCVHTLRDTYRKRSMIEFIRMLSESLAVRERQNAWII